MTTVKEEEEKEEEKEEQGEEEEDEEDNDEYAQLVDLLLPHDHRHHCHGHRLGSCPFASIRLEYGC